MANFSVQIDSASIATDQQAHTASVPVKVTSLSNWKGSVTMQYDQTNDGAVHATTNPASPDTFSVPRGGTVTRTVQYAFDAGTTGVAFYAQATSSGESAQDQTSPTYLVAPPGWPLRRTARQNAAKDGKPSRRGAGRKAPKPEK